MCVCVCVCVCVRAHLIVSDSLWSHQAPVPGISQARILEWVAILSFPTPGDLTDPEIKPESPESTGRFFTTLPPGKPVQK